MTVSVKMSSKNQIVVPKEAREALGLESGDRLMVSVQGDVIRMEKQPDDLEDQLEGALRELGSGQELWSELVDEA